MSEESAAVARRALALIDLTELGDAATAADVERLCHQATGPHGTVAAVCVWPRFVRHAVEYLHTTPVRVATVVNFPSGDEAIENVVAATTTALTDGADEIDLVLPYRALLAGDRDRATATVAAVRRAVSSGDRRLLKVILETGALRRENAIRGAAELAIRAGADFIKTSTGKTPISATLDATGVMLEVIGSLDPAVGLKPSGGIRTLADATGFLQQADHVMGPAWVSPATFRFGASGLLAAVESAIAGRPGAATGRATGKADY